MAAKNLVIVESPAKARTLEKYLGRDFQVKASVGHVVDLPKSKLGVDVKKDFTPDFHVIQTTKKVIEDLKKAAKGKEHIYLASDPDREGEAIAWHIADQVAKNHKRVHRLYQAAHLQVRRHRRKQLTRGDRVPLPGPARRLERWSMDFTVDR